MDRRIFVLSAFFVFACLVISCECGKHSRRKKIRDTQQFNASSSEDTLLPVTRNKTRLYSSWSAWTKCSRRCRQMRIRHCRIPSECGTSLLREERTCFKDKCRDRQVPEKMEAIDKILNDKETASSEFRILYHLSQPSPYSEWTAWTPCSSACLTHRSKTCRRPEVCGQNVLYENIFCYVEGSACERLYSRRRKRKKSSNDISVPDGLRIHPLTGLKCGISPKMPSLRIIGGREAARGSWPWQVTILNKFREPFCGGTLLSERWVLTAAHCVRKRLLIRAGEHDLMSDEGTEQESRMADAFVHPVYDSNTVNNDVALLKLRHPFTFNQFAQPVCLPSPTDELEINTRAIILGWGKRKDSAIYGTDHLHQAEVPIVSLEDCRENYESYRISSKMICAGFKKGRVDSCAGDSGGPLLLQKDGKWTIYGITSFGEGCGQKGKYGIYANVAKFVKWIKKTIARNS